MIEEGQVYRFTGTAKWPMDSPNRLFVVHVYYPDATVFLGCVVDDGQPFIKRGQVLFVPYISHTIQTADFERLFEQAFTFQAVIDKRVYVCRPDGRM